jgi:hypothetical protein
MFFVNEFASTKSYNKGQSVRTLVIGDVKDNPQDRSNTHIGQALAIRLAAILRNPTLAVEFVRDLHIVAGLNPPTVYGTPAAPVAPPVAPPVPSTPQPSLSTEETINAIHATRDMNADTGGKAKPAKEKKTRKTAKQAAAMQPAPATVPSATINMTVAQKIEKTRDELIEEGKALGMAGIAMWGKSPKMTLANLAAKVAAKRGTVKPATPAPAATPEIEATPAPAARAAKRVLITMALGENNEVYAIYRTENGTLVAVADVSK